jgi:hypothetical protein
MTSKKRDSAGEAVDTNNVIRPDAVVARRRYKVEDLLAACDFDAPESTEVLEWLNDPPIGREII